MFFIVMISTGIASGSAVRAEFALRDPLGGVDDLVPLPHFTSLLLPAGALAAVLLFTEADSSDSSGMLRVGRRFMFSRAGWFLSYHESQTDIFEGSAGFGINLRTWLSVGAEFHLSRLRDERIATQGVGARPFLRWTFVNSSAFAIYFEQGLGMIFLTDNFPPGGTQVNFTPVYGLGGSIAVGPAAAAVFSLRHYHISNGKLIAGENRNPGFDSNGFYLGYRIDL